MQAGVPGAPDRPRGLPIADPAPGRGASGQNLRYLPAHRSPCEDARPVTIIDIDEKSLAKLGQFPWPRTRIADLIANLTKLGAVVIGFDIVFSEPDRLNPGRRSRHYSQP